MKLLIKLLFGRHAGRAPRRKKKPLKKNEYAYERSRPARSFSFDAPARPLFFISRPRAVLADSGKPEFVGLLLLVARHLSAV